MKTATLSVMALATCLVLCEAGYGQSRIRPPTLRPNQIPTTSPYLNLSGAQTPALNYFRRTRPELQFLAADRRQSQQLRDLNRDVRGLRLPTRSVDLEEKIGPTGHSVIFSYRGGYFRQLSPYFNTLR